jgi:hypothetical protein
MRLRRKRRGTQPVIGDPEGVRRAEQRLRASEAADEAARLVTGSLQQVRKRNNVTAVATVLLRGGPHGSGALPG